MHRSRRRVNPLTVLLVGVAFWSLLPGPSSVPALAVRALKQRVADAILACAGSVVQASVSLLPGVVAVAIGYAVFTRRDRLNLKSWALLVATLLLSSVLWAASVRFSASEAVGPHASGIPEQAVLGPVHSGEAVIAEDGRFVSLPDPTKPEGAPLDQGWQGALGTTLAEAVKGAQEQVVLVFSRQGCPWCEKQLPVLQRAIASRADDAAAGSPAGPEGLASERAERPVGASLLLAPLRVFVLDVEEFPYLAHRFEVEAFPTSVFFGQPGTTPLASQGYLDDEQLTEMLHAAALAQPSGAGAPRQKLRRSLFR